MAKEAEAKKEAATKVFTGTVVSSDGLKIGAKKTKAFKKGDEFSTGNESLYLNLVKRKIIK